RAWRPEIPADLDAIVTRMMAVHPADRFETPQMVMQALLPFLHPEMRDGLPSQCLSIQPVGRSDERHHQILVVDDEAEIRRFARYALETEGGPQCDEA